MRSENNIIYISIGGKEYPTKVLYKDVEWFFKVFNKAVQKNKHRALEVDGVIKIPVQKEVYLNIIWRCIFKQGFLFWKKPFISKRQMYKNILKHEWNDLQMFVSQHVLDFENKATDSKSKKKITQTKE